MYRTNCTSQSIGNLIYERDRQDGKWGEQNHSPEKWIVILIEECGEAAKAILEKESYQYRDELIHVAAVAIAAVESFDRNLERDVKVPGGEENDDD